MLSTLIGHASRGCTDTADEPRPPRLPRRHRHAAGRRPVTRPTAWRTSRASRSSGSTPNQTGAGAIGASVAGRTTRPRTPGVRARSTPTTSPAPRSCTSATGGSSVTPTAATPPTGCSEAVTYMQTLSADARNGNFVLWMQPDGTLNACGFRGSSRTRPTRAVLLAGTVDLGAWRGLRGVPRRRSGVRPVPSARASRLPSGAGSTEASSTTARTACFDGADARRG